VLYFWLGLGPGLDVVTAGLGLEAKNYGLGLGFGLMHLRPRQHPWWYCLSRRVWTVVGACNVRGGASNTDAEQRKKWTARQQLKFHTHSPLDFKLQLSCCHRSIFVAAATYMYSAAFEQNIASERRSELMRYYSVSLLGLLHFILHHFYINLSIFRHNRWRLPCRVTTLTYIRIYSSGRISMCVFLVLRSCWCTTLWTYR